MQMTVKFKIISKISIIISISYGWTAVEVLFLHHGKPLWLSPPTFRWESSKSSVLTPESTPSRGKADTSHGDRLLSEKKEKNFKKHKKLRDEMSVGAPAEPQVREEPC